MSTPTTGTDVSDASFDAVADSFKRMAKRMVEISQLLAKGNFDPDRLRRFDDAIERAKRTIADACADLEDDINSIYVLVQTAPAADAADTPNE